MGGLIVNAVVLLAVVVAVLTTLVPAVLGLRRQDLGAAAQGARRRSLIASAAAGTTGAVALAAWLALGPDNDTLSLPVLPALVGIAMTVVAVVAEQTWPRPTGDVRAASLRMPGSPASGSRLALTGAAIVLAVLAIGSMTDSSDGRMALLAWETGSAGHSPYPGSFYTGPLMAVGVILALLTWWGLREVEGRPALGPGLEDVDSAARAASRVRVLRGATFASLVTAGALVATMSTAWASLVMTVRDQAPPGEFEAWWWTAIHWGSVAFIFVGVALALLGVKVLLSPGPPMPSGRSAPSVPSLPATTTGRPA